MQVFRYLSANTENRTWNDGTTCHSVLDYQITTADMVGHGAGHCCKLSCSWAHCFLSPSITP
eukprot:scaffold346388_cov41-Prasinocladus_malaysianus.AAC.1